MGETSPLFKKSVFINCPFDETYRPLLKVLIFTLIKYEIEHDEERHTLGN